MTTQAIITCVILVITMVLLISQKVPLVILGAAIPAALAATGVINAGSAYTEFGNTTIVFFMGLVVVGEAFFKTGLADFIGGKIIGLLGKTEKGLLLGTGLVAGGLSAFLNDTGSTACLMPIVSSMASKAGVKKSKLLMALAFFASLGGTITLVGTTPHIVANGILKDMGLREFGFFEYTKIGLPLLVCGILYMCFCGTKLLPDKDIEIKGGDRTAEYDTKKMVLVAVIFIGVLVAMATSIVPMHIAGVIGAILVVVTGCISLDEAIKAFPTSTIFIVGGIFPLSKALVSSGAAEYLVNAISSMIKNVKSVIVPNTDNMKGLEAAAAAGIVAGKQEKKLEVIADVTPEQTKAIRAYLDQTDIKVRHVENGVTFDIILTVWKGEHSAQVRIAVFHTNIVHVEKDGEVLVDIPVHGDDEETLTDRSLLDMEHIWDFANTVDVEDVRSILEPQIRCNMAIAEEGLRGNYGANIGSVLLDMEGNDVRVRAKAYAAAGSDARMNGCEQPVVINSGSGNQGITASVPVIVYARELGVSDETLLRALTLSNLTTIHEKTPIGRLSAYCGAISAGAGAGAGIAYLCGGDYDAVIHTVVNALAVVSGVICDGAKASCAAKIATAVEAGLLGYNMYIRGNQFRAGDGIVAKGVENSLKNVGRLGKQGMKETNNEIIAIMVGC